MEKYGEESHGFAYDVFLSFRGEDTRNNFTGHLLKKLQEKGIHTFFDDENLRIGDVLSPAFFKAIEDSKISIIVFSHYYATSKWCLAELEKIIECTERNNQQLAFPIFYHVDPSDVRNQRNSYGEAMIDHEERFGKDSEKIQAWRSVLSKAANLKGLHIQTGSEAEHIEEIVEKVSAHIAPKPLHVGEELVALKHRIEEVKSLLDMNDETRCMLGIYGLGGIGKTELAKVLYNEIVYQFKAASFLANVSEKSNKISGLEDLQKTLLSEMLEELETELGSTSKGIYEIKRRLGKKKVLLVLDDVDDREQLNNLAGRSDWFGPGSRIIITTRDEALLDGHRFQKTYKMTELNDEHSLELFCLKAFGKSHPETGYEDMSSRAVRCANGLPLALRVIGSDLANEESLEAWEEALEEYERTPHEEILKVLEISYNRLGDDGKNVFLDIACFFKGERIEHVKEVLREFGKTKIKELVNKSLLSIEHGCLNMHDLIQKMGREIVKREPIPGKRSRLWFYKDVIAILAGDSGSDAIQGIMLDPPQREEVKWSGTAFEAMKWLRILIVRNTSFTVEPRHLPNHLKLLDWEEYPSKYLPSDFNPRDIIVFKLTKSQLTLLAPFKKFSCLTDMNFSGNKFITAMPDMSEVQNLRELRLNYCTNLTTVHESLGFLKYLAHLSALGCSKLTNFLQRMFLPSLEVLDLNLCVKLEHFPDIVSNMNKPLQIFMVMTSIERLPDSIGNLTGLVSLDMPNSRMLKYLPSSLFTLPNVVAFNFRRCSKLGEFFRRFLPNSPSEANGRSTLKTLNLGNIDLSDEDLHPILICFPELEELIASHNNFVSLPALNEEYAHLTNLDVSCCNKLRKIHKCSKLRSLIVPHCVMLEHISELPCTIQKVDASYCLFLTIETTNMLWDQVKKERCGLEIVMPRTEIPEWFDYSCKGSNPRFWARGKFPIVVVALMFEAVIGRARKPGLKLELHLVINGKCVPRKGNYNFGIEGDHVLICDLRLLFSEEEWLGLDAFLEHEWNQVQVSYKAPSTVTPSHWGVFVYKKGTNMEEYVQFMCPDPKYSDIANIARIVPTRDPLEGLSLDEVVVGLLDESVEDERLAGLENFRDLIVNLMGLANLACDNDKDEATSTNFDHKDGMKPSTDVGEASTSGHQGSSEAQGSNPQKEEIWREIFLNGIWAGLREAQSSFPSINMLKTILVTAGKRGNWVRLPLPESESRMKIYMEGIINGLLEAKLSFPTLDVGAILASVLRRQGQEVVDRALLEWTKVTVPSSDDPSLELFKEGFESEAKIKLFCKLMEEQTEKFKNKTSALRKHSVDGTDDDAQAKESTLSHSKSALSSTNMPADIGIAEYDELCDFSKRKAEELRRLYDDGIEGFQSSDEFQDLVTAVYLNGLRDELLETHATLLALVMNRKKFLVRLEEENEEHVTHKVAKDDVNEAADNENPDKTIGVADIPNATGPEVDKPEDTSYDLGLQLLEEFGHLFY